MSNFKVGDKIKFINNLALKEFLADGGNDNIYAHCFTNGIAEIAKVACGMVSLVTRKANNSLIYARELNYFKLVEEVKPNLGNPKYDKTIVGKYDSGTCTVDVYRVLSAFEVLNPQLQHLVKKALNVGVRGHKDERQDLVDIVHSAQSALDMYDDSNS